MPTTEPIIVGAPGIAREHAAAVWSNPDTRAEWSIGALDVPPAVEAHLRDFERRAYHDVHAHDDVLLIGGPDDALPR